MKSKSKKQTKLIVEETKPSEPTGEISQPILENKADLSKTQDNKKSKKQKPVKLNVLPISKGSFFFLAGFSGLIAYNPL